MKKTFKVTMRKTITFTQVIEVHAGNDLNATDMAENRINDDKWEYENDDVNLADVQEVKGA